MRRAGAALLCVWGLALGAAAHPARAMESAAEPRIFGAVPDEPRRADAGAAGQALATVADFRLPEARGLDGGALPAPSAPRFRPSYRLQPDDPTEAAPASAMLPADGAAGPSLPAAPAARNYATFGRRVGAVKWEMAAILGYYTAINGTKLFQNPTWPHEHSEGWFGTSTNNVGVDKLAHAYSAYVISELLYARLKRKTDDAPGIAATAAVLASSTMLYTELWDSIERSAGWSWEDVAFNSMGAGFSLLRNSVPGLDRKLDYRLMIVPNGNILNTQGKAHFAQQRYLFALKLSGFKAFEKGPLRFLEVHAGYYGKDFSNSDHAMGIRPQRRIYVGFGINLRELFFRNAKGRIGRAVGEGLDYFQPPYTEAIIPLTR